MTTKASIVVMSHLSDSQAIIRHTSGVDAIKHINFAKYVILKTNGDLNQEIDPDKLWSEFIKQLLIKKYN